MRVVQSYMSACPTKVRRLSHWQADARRLSRNSTESFGQSRYVVSPSPDVPCLVATGGRQRGRRTLCAETGAHSPRRSRCRLLAAANDADASFHASLPMGMHLSEVGFLRASGYKLPALFTGETEAAPYEVTALGPFVDVGTRRLRVIMVSTMDLVEMDPEYGFAGFFDQLVPNRHFPGGPLLVRYVPTLPMIERWLRLLREPAEEHSAIRRIGAFDELIVRASEFAATLDRRLKDLDDLREDLRRDPSALRNARAIVKHAFEWAMYERRWSGPGTPYPIETSSRLIGGGRRASSISQRLVGKHVRVLSPRERYPADAVHRGRLQNMADANFNTCIDLAERHGDLSLKLKLCEWARPVDGTYYPSSTSLVGYLNALTEGDGQVGDEPALLQRHTILAIHSCKMMATYLYDSEPAWIKFEGEPMPLRTVA
jgi:hypothetical protein